MRSVVVREAGDTAARWPRAWDGAEAPQPATPDSTLPSIGACTLFNDGVKFLTWVRYMRAIGVDTVYGYYNGNLTELDHLRADGADLVASGALRLGQWTAPYASWYGAGDKHMQTQYGSMSSCLARHRGKHAWMALLDDDEYLDLRAPPPATLKSYLGSKTGYTVRVLSRWAFAASSIVGKTLIPFPLPAGSASNLAALVADVTVISPDLEPHMRTKHFDSSLVPMSYCIHKHPDYDPKGASQSGDLSFLHVSGLGRVQEHVSMAQPQLLRTLEFCTVYGNRTRTLRDNIDRVRGRTTQV